MEIKIWVGEILGIGKLLLLSIGNPFQKSNYTTLCATYSSIIFCIFHDNRGGSMMNEKNLYVASIS